MAINSTLPPAPPSSPSCIPIVPAVSGPFYAVLGHSAHIWVVLCILGSFCASLGCSVHSSSFPLPTAFPLPPPSSLPFRHPSRLPHLPEHFIRRPCLIFACFSAITAVNSAIVPPFHPPTARPFFPLPPALSSPYRPHFLSHLSALPAPPGTPSAPPPCKPTVFSAPCETSIRTSSPIPKRICSPR